MSRTSSRGRPRRRRTATAAVATLIGLLPLLAASPAQAHDVLVSSSPADGSTVQSVPPAVSLTFNEPVQSTFAQVAVIDSAGAHHESGGPQVQQATVSQAVTALPAGAYTMSYRVVSDDGHPVSGSVAFTVLASAATSQPSSPLAASGSSASSTGGLPGWAVGGIVAVLVAALAGLVYLLNGRRAETGVR